MRSAAGETPTARAMAIRSAVMADRFEGAMEKRDQVIQIL
jgi:hypothetical protein